MAKKKAKKKSIRSSIKTLRKNVDKMSNRQMKAVGKKLQKIIDITDQALSKFKLVKTKNSVRIKK